MPAVVLCISQLANESQNSTGTKQSVQGQSGGKKRASV